MKAFSAKQSGRKSKVISPVDLLDPVEGPPLWVWAIIVGAIIAGKLALKWSSLRRLARLVRKNRELT